MPALQKQCKILYLHIIIKYTTKVSIIIDFFFYIT